MMASESYKYWATNRGWISTKFAVKNPVTHFLNLYKKKHPQSKPEKIDEKNQNYFSAQKRKNHTQITHKINRSEPKMLAEPEPPKPQTAPHHYTINSSIFLGKQAQSKQKTLHQPKRNKSLHMKKPKKLQEEIKNLEQINTIMTKIKEENLENNYSQKKFKATNCGRYKPQMIFLQPQMRTLTESVKLNTSIKAYDELQRRKTNIYRQINRSMDVDKKICDFEQYKRSTSVSHYQPIQYMTEYGCDQNEQQMTSSDKYTALRQSQKFGKSFKRKPNLSVLRNKLNFQYKKSDYKDKMSNITMEPQLPDMSFDQF